MGCGYGCQLAVGSGRLSLPKQVTCILGVSNTKPYNASELPRRPEFLENVLTTNKTLQGRSATFRVQGSGFFFFFFTRVLKIFFFDLNCCTISSNFSSHKINFLSRLGAYTLEASFFFLLGFFLFFEFFIFFIWDFFFYFHRFFYLRFFSFFLVFFKCYLHSGRSKGTRATVGRDTSGDTNQPTKVFQFVKLILRPQRSQLFQRRTHVSIFR